jgi:hypothetical protein
LKEILRDAAEKEPKETTVADMRHLTCWSWSRVAAALKRATLARRFADLVIDAVLDPERQDEIVGPRRERCLKL